MTQEQAVNELHEMARQHLAKTNNDKQAAATQILKHLSRNKTLLDVVLEAVIFEAVTYCLEKQLSQQRTTALSRASDIVGKAREVAVARYEMVMEFPLRSGTYLRDARRPEILSNAENYIKIGRTNLCRGRWLESVAGELKNDTVIVGTAVSAERLWKLYQEARAAMEAK